MVHGNISNAQFCELHKVSRGFLKNGDILPTLLGRDLIRIKDASHGKASTFLAMLRVATFNVEGLGGDRTSAQSIENRAHVLRPQLERLKADILCLQEVNGDRISGKRRDLTALKKLLEGTSYESYDVVSTKAEQGDTVFDVHNLVILSRLPLIDISQIRHDYVRAPQVELFEASDGESISAVWDRPILAASFGLPSGRTIHIVNLHLRAPLAAFLPGEKDGPFEWNNVSGWAQGFYLAALKRSGQALETRLHVEQIFQDEDDPLIAVCGDFNAEDYEVPLRLIAAADSDTGNGALAPRSLVPLDRSVGKEQRYTVRHYGLAQTFDHILASRALLGSFGYLEIHNETLGDELLSYGKVASPPDSFHAPVVAQFDLN